MSRVFIVEVWKSGQWFMVCDSQPSAERTVQVFEPELGTLRIKEVALISLNDTRDLHA